MLGKTHIVGSLAAAHAGLLIYLNNRPIAELASAEVPELYGVPVASPLPLVTYSLAMTVVLLFVLLVLRVGNWHAYTAYTLIGGMLLFGLYFVPETPYGFYLAMVMLAFAFGALLPDIDSEDSALGRYVKPISKLIPHRTITHTIWAVLLLGGIGWYTESIYVWALAAGYALHILQDSFSKQGICWLYPIVGSYDRFSGGGAVKHGRKTKWAYRTGGTGETVLFYGSIGIHALCIVLAFWVGFGVN